MIPSKKYYKSTKKEKPLFLPYVPSFLCNRSHRWQFSPFSKQTPMPKTDIFCYTYSLLPVAENPAARPDGSKLRVAKRQSGMVAK